MKHNVRGQPVEMRRYGKAGTPVVSTRLAYLESVRYSDAGIMTAGSSYFLTPEEARSPLGTRASSRVEVLYDANGNALESQTYHPLLKRTPGSTATVERQTKDGADHRTETNYFDDAGRLALGPDGYAREVIKNDAFGHSLVIETYGTDGNLRNSRFGIARLEMKYDERGQMIDVSMYVADGTPMESLGTPYRTKTVYGKGDKPAEITYYVHLPRSAPRTKDGSNPVRVIDRFDERGQKTERLIYRELSGSLAQNNLVYVVQRRDAKDRDIELCCVDAADKLMMGPADYARVVRDYDRRGLLREVRYFGLNGPIAPTTVGAHAVLTKRDAKGQANETSFLGIDGRPIQGHDGYATFRTEYDSAGRVVSESYFDCRAQPTNNGSGYHCFTQRYEGAARAEAAYFDKEKRPVTGPFGWSRMIRTAGANGSPPTWKALDPKGSPAAVEVVIRQVVPGSQGEKIGARPGDVIVSYNGIAIIDHLQLIELVDTGAQSDRTLILDRAGTKVMRIVQRGKVGVAMQARPKVGR
jgi:hypothetical protein